MVFVSLGEVFLVSFLCLLDCSYLAVILFTLYISLFSGLSHWERGETSERLGVCWAIGQSQPTTARRFLIAWSEFNAGPPRCLRIEALLQEKKLRARA